MLRVFRLEPNLFCLRMEGRMGREEALALERAWQESSIAREGKTCVVDLSTVTHFDHATGIPVVRRIVRDGAQIKAPSYAVHCLIGVVCEEQHRALQQGDRNFRSSIFAGDILHCNP